jgi:8-amino-7-oxononanoate synthase
VPDLFDKVLRFHELDAVKAAGLYPYVRAIRASEGNEVEIDGHRLVMAGSNNYLGLTHDARVKAAAIHAVEEFGSGCTGSRFLNGTLELHVELERRLSAWTRREAAITFSTGFQTNLGLISCLVGREDVVYSDRDNHACIVDGCRLSFGEFVKFRHNDMSDLQRRLAATPADKGKLIVVDGCYSMCADLAPLDQICELADRYGARVLVDEAHSFGVFGANGRGACEHFGVESRVDLVMGTFSKSFASLGGFAAGRKDVIAYVQHHARSLIFSASIAPASAAAALAALDVIEREPERRERVLAIAQRVRETLRADGFPVLGEISPIIPLVIGERFRAFRFWKRLYERGVFTNPVTAPAVPSGMDLIRMSFMSTHTDAQVDFVIEQVRETVAEFADELPWYQGSATAPQHGVAAPLRGPLVGDGGRAELSGAEAV